MYMPHSQMPQLPNSMEIEHEPTMLAESEYLKKPNSEEPPLKKKRVVSQKQLDNLKRARIISAEKRKAKKDAAKVEKERQKAEKKANKGKKATQITNDVVDDEDSSSDEDAICFPDAIVKPKPTPLPPSAPDNNSVEERVYQRLRKEKENRRTIRAQKREEEKERKLYEESIRVDEREKLLALVQEEEDRQQQPTINATAMLQPNKWDNLFKRKTSRFPF